jgi:hypothetical protein
LLTLLFCGERIARFDTRLRRCRAKLEQPARTRSKDEAAGDGRKTGYTFRRIEGNANGTGRYGKLMYDSSGHAMIMAKGLPAAPADKEYQLWFIVPGKKPMPGKTFATDSHGNGMMEDQVPAEAMNSAVFAITLERKGGANSPEGSMYLSSGS